MNDKTKKFEFHIFVLLAWLIMLSNFIAIAGAFNRDFEMMVKSLIVEIGIFSLTAAISKTIYIDKKAHHE